MFHLVAKIFLVLSFIVFLVSARNFAESRDAIQGLDLEKYSEPETGQRLLLLQQYARYLLRCSAAFNEASEDYWRKHFC